MEGGVASGDRDGLGGYAAYVLFFLFVLGWAGEGEEWGSGDDAGLWVWEEWMLEGKGEEWRGEGVYLCVSSIVGGVV